MNVLDDVLSAYRALQKKYGLPDMETANLHRLVPEHFHDEASLWRAIEEFAPTDGWLCFQSAVRAFSRGELERGRPEDGQLLNGEAVNARNESLRIRPDGSGGWWLDIFSEGNGEPCLVDEVRLVRRGGPGHLHYRRYWRHHEFHGMHQFAARFIGFSEVEE